MKKQNYIFSILCFLGIVLVIVSMLVNFWGQSLERLNPDGSQKDFNYFKRGYGLFESFTGGTLTVPCVSDSLWSDITMVAVLFGLTMLIIGVVIIIMKMISVQSFDFKGLMKMCGISLGVALIAIIVSSLLFTIINSLSSTSPTTAVTTIQSMELNLGFYICVFAFAITTASMLILGFSKDGEEFKEEPETEPKKVDTTDKSTFLGPKEEIENNETNQIQPENKLEIMGEK